MDSGQIGQRATGIYYKTTTEAYVQPENVTTSAKSSDAVIAQKNAEDSSAVQNMNIDKTLKSFITDALKAAGLPLNERMMELVKSLFDRQQPIDKNTLVFYNRLLGQHPGVNPETLIVMQKNGLHISKESIEQFENYKNSENQLFKNIDNAADNIGGLVKGLISENNGKAVDLLNGLAKFVNDMGQQNGAESADMATEQPGTQADTLAGNVSQRIALSESEMMPSTNVASSEPAGQENGVTDVNMLQNAEVTDKTFADALIAEFGEQLPAGVREKLSSGNLFEKLSVMLEELPKDKAMELAEKLDSKEFAGFAKEVLKEALFLEPEEVADKEKLTEYYKKLEAAAKGFLSVTGELGETINNSVLAKTFNNVADNVAFMNQVNEFMPYVQIPLKLLKEEAHGEFYVMKRRKQQTQQGDTLTAFLRLNMQHLGELDIMVKLKGNALDVDFKAENAEVAEFIADNLITLESRLKEKGYIPAMRVGEKEQEFDFEKDFLEAESNEGTIGRYSFDMKI